MLVYGSYELYKREIPTIFPDLDPNSVRFFAALLGDFTGSIWLAPFEGTKQRLQASAKSFLTACGNVSVFFC